MDLVVEWPRLLVNGCAGGMADGSSTQRCHCFHSGWRSPSPRWEMFRKAEVWGRGKAWIRSSVLAMLSLEMLLRHPNVEVK